MVDIGGYKLETLDHGQSAPTVVFDAGMVGGMEAWRPLQLQVSKYARTISYERAGLGESEPGPEPRTAVQIAQELRQLLTNVGAPPPYILVGHSAGGMYVRVFAAQYADEIAGIVLVDPSTESIYEHMEQSQPERWANYTDEVRELYDPGAGWYGQWAALGQSIEQARQSWPLPAVPTVVLTGLKPIPGEWPLDTPQNMEIWLDAHLALADRIAGVDHIIRADADHGSILADDALPQRIIQIIEGYRE
jgi:pimeloyl-ACP methyl ester carboxylesterase